MHRSNPNRQSPSVNAVEFPPNRWVVVLFWVVLLCALYREVSGQFTLFYIGNFNLTIAEPIIGMSTWVLLRHAGRKPRITLGSVLALCYAVLLLINLMRGMGGNRYDAIITLRLNGGLAVILALSAFIFPRELWHPRVQRIVVIIGAILSALVIVRVIMGPGFLMIGREELDPSNINDGGRPLSAQGTIVLAMALVTVLANFMLPHNRGGGRPIQLFASLGMMLTVVLTKQATATIACFAACAALIALMPGRSRSLRMIACGTAAAVALFSIYVLPEVVSIETINSYLPSGMAFDVAKREATFEFRNEIWSGLMADRETWPWLSQVIGLPAGVKPYIWIHYWGGTQWELGLHSMYYGILPVAGIVGLAFYCGLLAYAAWTCLIGSLKGTPEYSPSAPIGLSLAIIAFIFSVSYDMRNENGLMLLLALAGGAPVVARYTARRPMAARRGAFDSPGGFEPRAPATHTPSRRI